MHDASAFCRSFSDLIHRNFINKNGKKSFETAGFDTNNVTVLELQIFINSQITRTWVIDQRYKLSFFGILYCSYQKIVQYLNSRKNKQTYFSPKSSDFREPFGI